MPTELRRLSDFNADRTHFAGFRVTGTATAGQVTNIDYALSEEKLVYGGQAILKNHVFGDCIKMQVVDVDNILGLGAGTVLGEYIQCWGVADDVQTQAAIMVEFPTKIITGLYLRIVYDSSGGSNVSVQVNVFAVKNIT